MALASMHLMFQVPLTYAITLQPILFGDSTFTYSCACQAEVAASAESELHVVIGIWRCLLECQDWSPTMSLFANGTHCTFFGEAYTVTSGNFVEHVFVKCPKWHVAGIEDFNIEHCSRCLLVTQGKV
jgi:hypothetical protein